MSKPKVIQKNPLQGATVLITGGTGSFGGAVCERLLREPIKEIRVFSRDEKKQSDMQLRFKGAPIKFYIGDVRDLASVTEAARDVDLIFHAAALKQVPTGEFFPMQAVQTNVLGSANVIHAGFEAGVKKIVCLSTDKAVMPVNAMGMTKALMEKLVQAKARTSRAKTQICCVRYGNVMASRGSVIPLFIDQLKHGAKLTVTDPAMTRFMMPLVDAVDLVLMAMSQGESGDIFIRKSPGCRIDQIAAALQHIFRSNVPVEEIGVRFGEKIHETLATASEVARAEDLGDHLRIPLDTNDLHYAPYFTSGSKQAEDYTSENTHQLTDRELQALLLTLPEVTAELEGWAPKLSA